MSSHTLPPQLPASTALGPTLLLGLIGSGIRKSRAPALHMHEAAQQGLTCVYQIIDLDSLQLGVQALPELLTAAERMGFAGLNITHPCKQAVIPLLDELSANADALGAVNTVRFHDGRRRGHNTDSYGFKSAFERDFARAPRGRVVQFGAGGAGAAVAHALLVLGVGHLDILDVEPERAQRLAEQMSASHGDGRVVAASDGRAVIADADGVVNATPIGMLHHPGMPFPAEWLRPDLWFVDIIYVPMETPLLAAARRIGCRTMNGGGMAVFQASRAFEIFTGMTADTERMSRHFASM